MDSVALRRAARAAREQPRAIEDRIDRAIASRRPDWGAYRVFRAAPLREAARWSADALRQAIDLGPLHGVPISVKDLFGLAGERTYAGTPRPLPARFEREGPVVSGLRRQGAIATGKTHTVELAFGGLGPNGHWGTPRNPWDSARHRVPGGSSSGAAVSLLDGTADLALGTDTAGSIRIPAAFCGLVGLKLTAGRWSTAGVVPLSSTLDSLGLMGRSVEDVTFGYHALNGDPRRAWGDGRAPSAGTLTLAVHERGMWDEAESDVDDAVRAALRELERDGLRVESTRVPEVGAALRLFAKGSVTGVECLSFVRRELPEWEALLEPNVAPRIRGAESVSGCEYVRRRARIARLERQAAARFAPGTVLVAPTVVRSAPTLDEVADPAAYRRINLLALRNTSVANTLGWCALSVPCGLDAQRLPIGLMLMAPGGREEDLLAAGARVERALGTAAERFGPLPGGIA